MGQAELTLLILGGLFLIGLVADVAGRLTPLPRVTLLMLAGLMVGPGGIDLMPQSFVQQWFPLLTTIALSVIGFLMGQKLSAQQFRKHGSTVAVLAAGKVFGAALFVFLVVWLVTENVVLALLLGGIATATDPATIFDVVHEQHSEGEFTDRLLGLVALDDAFGLVVFALLLAVAEGLVGSPVAGIAVVQGLFEVLGSVAIGAMLGVPMAYLTGRLNFGTRSGEPIQAEAMGFVLLCAGASTYLGLSPILSAMSMGGVVASLASHHKRSFDAIAGIEWPFLILFFVLAGASLVVMHMASVAMIALVYIVARGVGTQLGVWVCAKSSGAHPLIRSWMGLALLPQAGVALGMTLLASQRIPALAETLLSIVLSTTVVLELCSPVMTRVVLGKVAASSSNNAEDT